MRLTVRDAADLLGVPVLTIERWIRQGKIPAREARGRHFFIRSDLEKWAQSHNFFLHGDFQRNVSENSPGEKGLVKSMRRGGVFFHVPGENVTDVLKEAVSRAPLPSRVDRDLLLDMLLQRERLASTGVGGGVAIPHPRYPLEHLLDHPMITTCFLEKEVDFEAIDGVPVFVLFLLLSPTTRIHLQILSRLSFCLRDSSFLSFLKQCTEGEDLFRKVEELERRFDDG